jgi:hypothetical protein
LSGRGPAPATAVLFVADDQYHPMGNYLQRESAEAFAGGYSAIDTAQYDAYGNMLADIFANSGQPATSREESIGFGKLTAAFAATSTAIGYN